MRANLRNFVYYSGDYLGIKFFLQYTHLKKRSDDNAVINLVHD